MSVRLSQRIEQNLFAFLFRHQSLTHNPTATQAKNFKKSLDFYRFLWYRVVLGKEGDTMSILEELWYGRINPSQRMQPDDKSASELTEQIVEKEDELAALLSDEANEILEQMREKQLDLSTSNERKAFISGFRLGARMMLEVMDETDVPPIDN